MRPNRGFHATYRHVYRQVKHTGAPAGDKHTDALGMYLLGKLPVNTGA